MWEHLLAASFSEGTRRKQKTGSLSLGCAVLTSVVTFEYVR